MPPAQPMAPTAAYAQSAQVGQPRVQSEQLTGYEARPTASPWWQDVAPSSEPHHAAPRSEPLRTYQPAPAASQPLVSAKTEAVRGSSKRPRRTKSAPLPGKRSRSMGRRQAIALLATGGVVAAGAFAAVNFNLIHLGTLTNTAQTPHTTAGAANGQKPQQGNGQQTQQGNGAATNNPTPTQKKQAPAPPKANVVGSTTLATNSAATFNNPADAKGSILIHLPSTKFVAYESACTHEGVTVNYDPATRMLVCPAHGAIFDPAMGAKVVQGPAQTPLKAVAIRVNADGTITTA